MKFKRIGFWIHLAFLFLARSGRSTAALSIMVIVAVSALIFLSALAVGVNDAMLRNTVGLFSGHITGSNLPFSIEMGDLSVKGVKGVLKRVYLPGVLSSGKLGQPAALCVIDPHRETNFTVLHKKIIQGRYPQSGQSEVMISGPLAKELGVKLGARLQFTYGNRDNTQTLSVSGIYEARIEQMDRRIIFCALDALQTKGTSWSASLFLKDGVRPGKVIDRLNQKWPDKYRFESWETMMPDLKQLIDLEYISMGIVIILVFIVVAVGIACSFVIFIIKNMREYGIMRSMGVSIGEMSVLITMKIVLMNLVACIAGLLFGTIATYGVAGSGGIDITAFTSHNQYFTVSGFIYPRLTPFSLLAPPVSSFFFGLIAAIWPVVLLAKKKTADILRMV